MCGITGFFDTAKGAERPRLHAIGTAMERAIAHRGPDDSGVWQDPDVPLVLAQRRLAIIDLSPEGHQPKESHSGRYMVVFNGEIYNFPALQQELEAAGVKFRGRSDTEIMLAAFDVWGVNRALQKLSGMFAFALWDRQERLIHFARDRMGKKPLYIGWAGSALVFGSELKALRAHPQFSATVDRRATTMYMRYAYVPPPYSIYQNVWQLPAGCRLTLRLPGVAAGENLLPLIEPYWHHPRKVEEAKQHEVARTDKEAIDGLETVLKEAVRSRMISDVPLGAFLSGGIDSSTIVALMQQVAGQKVKTFAIGFEDKSYDESGHARQVAQHLGTDHHELIVGTKDVLNVIPQLPTMYDEPFADHSQIPTFLVAQMARHHVTVALSGDGGDEMLGGYTRYTAVPSLWDKVGWMPYGARRAMAAGMQSLPVSALNRMAPFYPRFGEKMHKAAELLQQRSAQDVYGHLLGNWQEPEQLVIGGAEPMIPLTSPEWQARGLSFTESLMYSDLISYLPNDILVKVDRATMAVALEARAPLLDTHVFDYAWSLPMNMKIRDGKGKWVLRELLARYVPRPLFERPKQGFAMPIGDWLRGDLRDWAEDLLSEDRLRRDGLLNVDMVRGVWADHLAGRGSHAIRLWCVLMFQSWHARWMSGEH
ncbi:MAG: asparagine synthase (glutamine-hydrolyzing) [Alphaproteobacteria bacterium]|nr:asparagine synthase (glutamine-hydrolyzing) [Alphaproteobacteria bacterium]